jgi:dihydropteroate synthase
MLKVDMPAPPPSSSLLWSLKGMTLDLGARTWIMGIVNTTPDSFSDGGHFLKPNAATGHALRLLDEGADILDIGGESTRPGAEPVAADEESARVIPVIDAVLSKRPDAVISVDTSKASVAKAALDAGAVIVNDVTAGLGDPELLSVVAASGAGLVMMHMQGSPRTMQQNPSYADVVEEVGSFFSDRRAAALDAGIDEAQLVFDPGIGFGKTLDHNLTLIRNLDRLSTFGRPLLLGVSRKRWLGELTGRSVDQRLAASLGGLAVCVHHGAKIMRVHDVIDSCDLVRIMDTINAVNTLKQK